MIKVNKGKAHQYPLTFRDLRVGGLYENDHGNLLLATRRGQQYVGLVVLRATGMLAERIGDAPTIVLSDPGSRYRLFEGSVIIQNED